MDRKNVFDSTLKYFNGDTLAADVWVNKYCLKNVENGEIVYYENTPDDMHRRISDELYRIEKKYKNPLEKEKIFDLLKNFKYIIPQGSPMSGIGNNFQIVSLSNCFVIGHEYDSYGSIIMVDEEQIQLMKRRGGVGHDLSHIRPTGTIVQNSALTSTGIVPFMERYSNSTKEVAQDGRRGALMLTCFDPDTFVLTDYGWDQIKNVIEKIKFGKDIKAWTHEGFQKIIDTQEFEDKDIYEIEAENGKTIKVTSDHEFMVRNIENGEEYLKPLIDIIPFKEELIFYIE